MDRKCQECGGIGTVKLGSGYFPCRECGWKTSEWVRLDDIMKELRRLRHEVAELRRNKETGK